MNASLLQNAYVYIVQRIFTNLDRYCQGRWLIACFVQINEFSSKLIFLKYCTNIKKIFDYIAVICNRILARLHKMYSKNVVFMILFPFFKMNIVSLYEATYYSYQPEQYNARLIKCYFQRRFASFLASFSLLEKHTYNLCCMKIISRSNMFL